MTNIVILSFCHSVILSFCIDLFQVLTNVSYNIRYHTIHVIHYTYMTKIGMVVYN